jgi:hypothetical protein
MATAGRCQPAASAIGHYLPPWGFVGHSFGRLLYQRGVAQWQEACFDGATQVSAVVVGCRPVGVFSEVGVSFLPRPFDRLVLPIQPLGNVVCFQVGHFQVADIVDESGERSGIESAGGGRRPFMAGDETGHQIADPAICGNRLTPRHSLVILASCRLFGCPELDEPFVGADVRIPRSVGFPPVRFGLSHGCLPELSVLPSLPRAYMCPPRVNHRQ